MTKFDLTKVSTRPPEDAKKSDFKKEKRALIEEFGELQNLLVANGKHSLLVVLQGMDASGKDGAVRDVFAAVSPMYCLSHSFKAPSKEELSHDFLWRVHKVVPRKGMIQIFNRSHYEDVLIQRVRKWIDEDTVYKRFEHINNFESLLADNGTVIVKFFLHVSKEMQLERLNERKELRRKNWKHNDGDFEERKMWDEYQRAYEDVLEHCGPKHPWTVVPADANWYKEYLMAKTIVERLRALKMTYPALPEA